jgi:hypothetical protein
MIQRWFANDTMSAGGYSLKAHGQADFWEWVTSWAVCIRKPSDIGDYNDDGYILPELIINEHVVTHESYTTDKKDKHGQMFLFDLAKNSATTMHASKKKTINKRMEKAAAIVNSTNDFTIVWCETNAEADLLGKLLPDAIEVRGNEKPDIKRKKLQAFSNGEYRVIITKAKIAAFGLNWQHAGRQVITSVTHKFESFYQAIKRSHRFGRTEPVTVHIVMAEDEDSIVTTIKRKWSQFEELQGSMVAMMRLAGMSLDGGNRYHRFNEDVSIATGDLWQLVRGDSARELARFSDVDFWVQSPPFQNLYIYSDNIEDLGNTEDMHQFEEQYHYILKAQYDASKDGTYKAEHCKDLPLYKGRDGYIGLSDFPHQLIEAHENAGWTFVKWITVWKDPVIEMQRTKNRGLLWSTAFCKSGETCRQGMADYTLIFKRGDLTQEEREYYRQYKPVSRMTIDRCLDLWSMPDHDNCILGSEAPSGDDMFDFMFFGGGLFNVDVAAKHLKVGRNVVFRVTNPRKMGGLIKSCAKHELVFHSRVHLTDGTWLVVFRNWKGENKEKGTVDWGAVTHDIAPDNHTFVGAIDGDMRAIINAVEATVPNKQYWENPNPESGWLGMASDNLSTEPIEGWIKLGQDGTDFHNDKQYFNAIRKYSINVWQRYASPVWFDVTGDQTTHSDCWMDIQQTNVLNNYRKAKTSKDEKHICPLQLDLIEKCIKIYTTKGQKVGSAFVGIGSEMVTATKLGRRAIGCELKPSYWSMAVRNLQAIEAQPELI